MSKVDRMTRLDRIKRAIDDDNDAWLSDAERTEKVELLTVCSMLLNATKNTGAIINMLRKEHGLSERQAFQRITDAKFVFGNVFSMDRSFERLQAYKRAEHAWKLARRQRNPDAMTRANDQMMKIVGADDPNDAIDPTKLEPSVYKAVLPADVNKAVKALLSKGAIDLGSLMMEHGMLSDAEVLSADEVEEEDQP